MRSFRNIWIALLCLAGPLAVVGCADSARSPTEKVVYIPDDNTAITIGDAGATVPGKDATPVTTNGHILVAAGDDELTINVGADVSLTVLLLDASGNPTPNASIHWDYDPVGADIGDAQLAAENSTTDENGETTIDFTGSTDVRDITVTAQGEGTRLVKFLIHVVEMPTGGVEVHFDYAGPVALGNVEVYVVENPAFCDDAHYTTPPQDVLLSGNTPSIRDSVTLSPLLSDTTVAVVVRARLSSNGSLAGAGCFGDVRIPAEANARITVPLFLLPLSPAGTYDALNHFDFTNAIPGTVGTVIQELVRFFGDQNHQRDIAGVLFDLVDNLVRQAAGAIGGFIIDVVRGWIEDDLNDIINNYIDNDGPPWLRDFFLIGSDLISIVSNLEVISDIQITKPRTDGTYDGSQSWIGVAFYWNLPCQGNPDPNCARHPFTLDQLAAGAEGINLVFGQFTGRIHTYNHGEIDVHTLDLQYGRLILFVLDNLILPAIADGAHRLRDALLNMANCPAFASGITGGDDCLRLAGICIAGRDTIEGWCSSVVGIAGDAAEAIVGNLSIDTHLTLSGHMTFVEENSDLAVDKLTDGVWEGTIRTAADQGPPFHGDFSGTRKE